MGRTGGSDSVRRGVISFDLSSIAGSSDVEAVSLQMHLSNTAIGSSTVSLHRLLSDWGEGTSTVVGGGSSGTPASPGDATWLHRFFDTAEWAVRGGDFAAEPSASLTVGQAGPYTWSSQGMLDDVNDWVDDPSSNFGWIVIGDESVGGTRQRFDSRENANEDNRPVLEVVYRPLPTVPSLDLRGLIAMAALLVVAVLWMLRRTTVNGADPR